MALVRDLGITLPAMHPTILITCSAAYSTASTAGPPNGANSTADVLASPVAGTPTTGFGAVIARLAAPLGTLYNVAMPSVALNAPRGSTETNRQLTLGVRLQHGDSS